MTILLLGDLNSETSETCMKEFCEAYNLKNLVEEPTCIKNPLNLTCIDLMITNRPRSFQDTQVIETGLSDFHKMTVSFLISSHGINSNPPDHFDEIFMPLVIKHIPLKFKYIRSNHAPFTNRPLGKAIC